MICPKCNAEYRPDVVRCADCDVALIPGSTEGEIRPAEPPVAVPEWVRLQESAGPAELPVVTSALDGAGIPFTLQGAHAGELLALHTTVWVPKERRKEAEAVVRNAAVVDPADMAETKRRLRSAERADRRRAAAESALIYAGFLRRAPALVIDAMVLSPLLVLYWILPRFWPSSILGLVVLIPLLSHLYEIYFLTRWGQTVGKVIMAIKVTQLDGSPISLSHALLRRSVDIMFSVAFLGVVGYRWSAFPPADPRLVLSESDPLFRTHEMITNVWMWSELIVLFFNKKKRALHDFIAGTVVIVSLAERAQRRKRSRPQ